MPKNKLSRITNKTLITIIILLLIFFFLYAFRVFLLVLGGALIALFFDGIAFKIQKKIPKIKISIVRLFSVMVFLLFFGLITYLLYPRITTQIITLKKDLPEAIASLKKISQSNEVLHYILELTSGTFKNEGIPEGIQKFFTSIFGFMGDLYIMVTLGLFFLIEPEIYKKGFIKLFPLNKRNEVFEIVNAVGNILKKWLTGKILSMLVVGVLTGIGLYILDVPLALSLAIIATFTAFIPNIGPIIALIPALLISFIKGEEYVLYTFLLYTIIQVIESNIITPLIQREAISFPMALILIAQVVLGLFTGYLGLVLATPVMAIFLFLIRKIYIEKYLEAKNK